MKIPNLPTIPSMTKLVHVSKHALHDNAPALLTAGGALGVVGTAVLTARATFAAAEKLSDAQFEKNIKTSQIGGADKVELTKTEKVKIVWPLYIEPFVAGTLSCGAILMAHRVSSRRAAVMAAAYALNEGKLEEYQDKVKEKFGIKKADEVESELAQDRINAEYDEEQVIFSPLDGLVLIREDYTGRFFWSKIEVVNKAVNEVNKQILDDGYVNLNIFHKMLGLDAVSLSDYVGWNQHEMLELSWATGVTPDGNTPVHTFDYVNRPEVNYRESPFRR